MAELNESYTLDHYVTLIEFNCPNCERTTKVSSNGFELDTTPEIEDYVPYLHIKCKWCEEWFKFGN